MQFNFDLISDLHLETWPNFDWSGQPTSPYCVVAGDVCQERDLLLRTLEHLGQCYQAVFYIDGNDEHRDSSWEFPHSYSDFHRIQQIKNVVLMHSNVVIINGVAILATNGWWDFGFDDSDRDQAGLWYQEKYNITAACTAKITSMAYHDAAYMYSSVKKLQTHNDIKRIVLVTHTVPAPWLIAHDLELAHTHRASAMGNQHMQAVLDVDTEHKIQTWCFGHYHRPVDQMHDGIRYVNNCRGRGNTAWSQVAYYPKRITVEF